MMSLCDKLWGSDQQLGVAISNYKGEARCCVVQDSWPNTKHTQTLDSLR